MSDREANEPCPTCGAGVICTLGPDHRFSPPCSKPKMWNARCSGDCFDTRMSWTAFTRERAIELWNNGVRAAALAGDTGEAAK